MLLTGLLVLILDQWINPIIKRETVEIAVVYSQNGLSAPEHAAGYKAAEIVLGERYKDVPLRFPIRVEYYDDSGSVLGAKRIARRMIINHRRLITVGHFSSTNTEAALPIYTAGHMPLLMPTATQTDLTHPRHYPFAFRLIPTNVSQAEGIVRFVTEELHERDIYIIHGEQSYSATLAEEVHQVLATRGIQPVGTSIIHSGQDNFTMLDTIQAFDPRIGVVIFCGYAAEGNGLIAQARRRGITSPIVASDGLFGESFLDYARSLDFSIDSLFVLYPVPPLDILTLREEWRTFSSVLWEVDSTISPTGWASWAYDALSIAYDVVRRSLDESNFPSRDFVYRTLHGEFTVPNDTDYEYQGALGAHHFNTFRNNDTGRYYVYKYVDYEYQYFR